MITINTDKGLVKVDDWEDILSRPGFDPNLNPRQSELETIIGRYIFSDKVNCGLSSCHTPHTKGYLVATKDGRETNIGKDCGKKYFSVEFETLSRKFDRDVTESDNRESLWSFHFQLEELENKIRLLREGENRADEIYKKSQLLLKVMGGCPRPISQKVSELVRVKSNIITVPRIATAKEVEDIEVIEKRKIKGPHYIDEPVAQLDGLEVLYKENDLRQILIMNILQNLNAFKKLNIDQLSYKELQHWVKWKGTIEVEMDRAEYAISRGTKLLSRDNLQKLSNIPLEKEEKALFKDFLKRVVLS